MRHSLTNEEALLPDYGVDYKSLSKHSTISDETRFFMLLQCHTDRLYSFYFGQERDFLKRASLLRRHIFYTKTSKDVDCPLDNSTSSRRIFHYQDVKVRRRDSTVANQGGTGHARGVLYQLFALKKEVKSLKRFLELNREAYSKILEEYGDLHDDRDVFENELEELLKTHCFWDGERVSVLLELIDDTIALAQKKMSSSQVGKRFSLATGGGCDSSRSISMSDHGIGLGSGSKGKMARFFSALWRLKEKANANSSSHTSEVSDNFKQKSGPWSISRKRKDSDNKSSRSMKRRSLTILFHERVGIDDSMYCERLVN